MSGIFAQLGAGNEVTTTPAITSIANASGTTATILFASAHTLAVGDQITMSGFTPSGYNAAYLVQTVPDSTHVTITLASNLGNSSVSGTWTAPTYGRAATIAKFVEFGSEGVKLDMGRIESQSIRAGSLVGRSDRWALYRNGAKGPITFEVLSRGLAWWLDWMLGQVTTTGPTDTAAYTHAGVPATLAGKSKTIQVGRPFATSANPVSVQPETYLGCKCVSWELSCDVDGMLVLTVEVDARDKSGSVALATASFPAVNVAENLSFVGGSVTVAGVAYDVVKKITIKGDNKLKTDRKKQRASALKKEPLQEHLREYTIELEVEFDSMTQLNRFESATAAGAMAAVVCAWAGPSIIAGCATTVSSVTVTAQNARFDGDPPVVGGMGLLEHNLTLKCLYDLTNPALGITVVSGESTP